MELLTTARRKRYYATRVLHGTILLLVLWVSYSDFTRNGRTARLSPIQLSQFAANIFSTFAVFQSIAILVVTPAIVAGAIADETQRKTLHYLLGSSLSSSEIVMGKLFARSLHVLVFLALGLPVISLLGLLGGIDPLALVLLDLGTLTTAFFLAGLSLLVSTFARRVRDALVGAFLVEAVWLFLPVLVFAAQIRWRQFFSPLLPVIDWVLASNPFWLIFMLERTRGNLTVTFWSALARFCGMEVLLGLAFVAFATWRLRPAFRKSGGEARRGTWSHWWRTRRARRRRPVGDDPMLWKETCTARPAGMVAVIARVVGFLALLGVAFGIVYFGWPAARELAAHGYSWVRRGEAREELSQFLRIVITALSSAWLLAVTVASATSFSTEREQDTWISLTTSPLTAPEIVWAKLLGAAWPPRPLGYAILCLACLGLVAGAIHPLGVLLFLVVMAIYASFVSALGGFISLSSSTSMRSLAVTVIVLAVTNGGYLLCILPFVHRGGPWMAAGVMPYPMYMSLMSYRDVWMLFGFEPGWGPFSGNMFADSVAAMALTLGGYGGLAAALTVVATLSFDRILGRPRSFRLTPPLPKAAPKRIPQEAEV
jgi:ABC-type transport system involved in multi-copper enzyme maturation permease subunit